MVLPDGTVGVAMADDKTFEREAAVIRAAQAGTVPAHLACGLCERLVQDAVTITCCDVPFCDACVRKVVTATGTCPSCQKEGVLCDDLEPDEDLRRAAREHLVGGGVQPASAVPRLPAAPSASDLPKTEDTPATENNAIKRELEAGPPTHPPPPLHVHHLAPRGVSRPSRCPAGGRCRSRAPWRSGSS